MTDIKNGDPVMMTHHLQHAAELAAQNGKEIFRHETTDPKAADGYVYTAAYLHEGKLFREGWHYWPEWTTKGLMPPPIYLSEYQILAGKTGGAYGKGNQRVIQATLGLVGEAGEFANLIKKKYAHGHPIRLSELAVELGDIMWYLAEIASALGLSLVDIARANIQKLKRRYPQGFSKNASENREF